MGIVEKIIVIIISVFAVISLVVIFLSKRKKSEKSKKSEPKVEPVYKKTTKEEAPEPAVPEEQTKTEPTPFKIIRKQSKVKISKKALSSGSRNPSVTKVFGKDAPGQKAEENPVEEPAKVETKAKAQKKDVPVERFGVKEYEYNETNTPKSFKIIPPEGSPQRSFELQDRTAFHPHLNVSEDGNLSGVVGVGINKALGSLEEQVRSLEEKNQQMIKSAHSSVNISDYENEINDFFENRARLSMPSGVTQNPQTDSANVIKNLDPKTLIVAEAIANPKYKNLNSKTDSDEE